ncbi:MAG: DUF4143 domain-containing protein [Proteobacteria bacterium]|nr:DUF4143 domain-containing protein [Pseudomonadota bacterium]
MLAWTEIAQATFQWFTIPAFSRNPIKKIAGKEKGYFSDTGFLCYLQRISSPEAIGSHPLKGSLFETYYPEPAKADKSFAMNCGHIICYQHQRLEKVSLNGISNDLHQYLAVLL